ncbi:MAG TPA: hypothetical protein VKQ32_00220, partial [Polyangia bacterium]|nr:hypothetical protein [Polyangia bacterium]
AFSGAWTPHLLSGAQRPPRRAPMQHTNRRARLMCAVVFAANNGRTFEQLIADDCANPQTSVDGIKNDTVEFKQEIF